jgi:hypothetical protein
MVTRKPRPEVTGMTLGVCENVQIPNTCMTRHSTPGLRVEGQVEGQGQGQDQGQGRFKF